MGLFSFLFDQQTPSPGGFMSEATRPKADPNAPDPGMSVPPHLTAAADPSLNGAFALNVPQGDLGEARALPHMETQPGLLHRAADALMSPTGMLALGTALRGYSGDDNAVSDAGQILKTQREMAQFQRQLALQQRGNQAFRAAYVTDPKTGQTRFNPQIYAQVMGDALDPKDMVAMAKAFAPEESLQDGFITRKDPLTGSLTITGQRPMNYGEQTAEQQAAETHRHNTVDEGQGQQRIGIEGYNAQTSRGQLGVAQQNAATSSAHLAFDKVNAARQAYPGTPVALTPQDLAAIPSGHNTAFIAPDGTLRHKP